MIFFSWTEYIIYSLITGIPPWLGALIMLGVLNAFGLYTAWPYIFAISMIIQGSVLAFGMKPKQQEQVEYLKKTGVRIAMIAVIIVGAILVFFVSRSVIEDQVYSQHDVIDRLMGKLMIQFDMLLACFPIILFDTLAIYYVRSAGIINKWGEEIAKKQWFKVYRIVVLVLVIVAGIIVIANWETIMSNIGDYWV